MRRSGAGRLVLVALATVGLLLAGRTWLLEPVRIESGSMRPTLQDGQYVLVWKAAVAAHDWRRADVVMIARGDVLLVKRIAAVGGDRVAIRDGRLVVNGRRVAEPWSDPRLIDSVYFGPVDVPAGSVFVLGDNRADSVDSRDFGPVAVHQLDGRVMASVWPPAAVSPGAGPWGARP